MPATAADPPVSLKDLKGISPQKHRYWFSVIGGAAVGAAIGFIVGSGNDATKGLMVGGGGLSAYYLHTHKRDDLKGWRNWAQIGGNAVLGGGAGWTLCGCTDGLVAGTLIGGGGTAAWIATRPQRPRGTATGPHP